MNRERIDELAAELMQKQKAKRVAEHSKVWEPLSTTATDLGYSCERRIVYHRLNPKDAAPFGDGLLSIFGEGDLHQKDVRRELGELGYEVVEAEVRFSDKRLDIAGTIDGKICVTADRDTHTQKRIPVEIKSTSGDPPTTQDGLKTAGSGLYRRYYAQMQTYLYLTSEPFGLFIFKNKIDGLWSVVPVELDYEYAETLLQRSERVRDFVASKTLPNRTIDRSECDGCPWRDTICLPGDAPVDPLLLAADDGLLKQLELRETVAAASKSFDKVDTAIKDRFKATPGERFVVGGVDGFLVTKRAWGKGTKIEICRLSEARKAA